jgi:hypothetical protein
LKKKKKKGPGWAEGRKRGGNEGGWFTDFGNFKLLFENYNTQTNKTNATTCMHSNT